VWGGEAGTPRRLLRLFGALIAPRGGRCCSQRRDSTILHAAEWAEPGIDATYNDAWRLLMDESRC